VCHFSALFIQAVEYEIALPWIVGAQQPQLGQVGRSHIGVSQLSPCVDLLDGIVAPHGVHAVIYSSS